MSNIRYLEKAVIDGTFCQMKSFHGHEDDLFACTEAALTVQLGVCFSLPGGVRIHALNAARYTRDEMSSERVHFTLFGNGCIELNQNEV